MTENRRYRGLLIGNATYPRDPHALPVLNGPLADVAQLKQVLTDPQVGLFDSTDVEILSDDGVQNLRERVDDLFTAANREDVLLLYYSGHGQLDERGTLYLCAADTKTASLRATALSAIEINNITDGSPATTTVIILDCCHSGAFKGISPVAPVAGRGHFVLTSSRSTQLTQAASHTGQPSPFTGQFIHALRTAGSDTTGHLTVTEAYRHVHHCMTAGSVIAPQLKFDGEGDVAIARRPISGPIPQKTERPTTLRTYPPHQRPQDPAGPLTTASAIHETPTTPTALVEPQARGGDNGKLNHYANIPQEEFEADRPSKGRKYMAWAGCIFAIAMLLWSSWLTWKSVENIDEWLSQSMILTTPPLTFLAIVSADVGSRAYGINLPWYAYPFASVVISIGPLGYVWDLTEGRDVPTRLLGISITVMPIAFQPYLFRGMSLDFWFPELHPDVKRKLSLERAKAATARREKADSIHLAESIRRYQRLKGKVED